MLYLNIPALFRLDPTAAFCVSRGWLRSWVRPPRPVEPGPFLPGPTRRGTLSAEAAASRDTDGFPTRWDLTRLPGRGGGRRRRYRRDVRLPLRLGGAVRAGAAFPASGEGIPPAALESWLYTPKKSDGIEQAFPCALSLG
ncbi:hypothetical protein NDU88_003534 [Pleurodeles waltl]|uniref:Uncharacterized protein n=1 Tax=Pleurodeles waltl TaxID=8319 RepID=A0AAV7UCT3_PLEWA|nr:hypothetical protein NDU88_003534 [Pleurodeles waltl]